MSRDFFEQLVPLTPSDFFNIAVETPLGKKVELPDTSELLIEESFAEVSIRLEKEGVFLTALIKKPFEECFYPDYEKGDCMELFFDTRDLKTAGFMTRFCHHFLIMPAEVQGISSLEITRFRTEDSHPLCDPAEIEVKPNFSSNKYSLDIFLPASCLHGYEPTTFNRLGFTYQINRPYGDPQHFSVSSRTYNIVQHPSFWATLQLR